MFTKVIKMRNGWVTVKLLLNAYKRQRASTLRIERCQFAILLCPQTAAMHGELIRSDPLLPHRGYMCNLSTNNPMLYKFDLM